MAWSDGEQKFEKTYEARDDEHNKFLTKHVAQAKGIGPRFRISSKSRACLALATFKYVGLRWQVSA